MTGVRRDTATSLAAIAAIAASLVAAFTLAACGGSDAAPPPTEPPPTKEISASAAAGNDQVADAGAAVPVRPAVLVTERGGRPVAGARVTFTVTAGGGTVDGSSTATDDDGVATVGSWRLGTTGQNVLRATVSGVSARPVEFRATARPGGGGGGGREWTVMVYLAGDNNLAVAGVQDIDEMEAAGADDRVAIAVQAEFNPSHLQRAGCNTPACINRPNWDTFRFAIGATGNARRGPDGPSVDIGNRDMTRAAELRDFVQWAKATYPARRYALVLWNHGGGYTGLIEDVTSAGSRLMSLDDVRTALGEVGGVDVLDFDMCLMAGYETLAKLAGVAGVVKFSEEAVPGAGNPYREMLRALRANPTAPPAAVGTMFADQFHQSYRDDQASTTVSVYDMAGFPAFEQALNAFATDLRASLTRLTAAVGAAASASQRFGFPFLADLGDFVDSLDARSGDATVRARATQLRAAAKSPAFRLRSYARNGRERTARPVERATGLHVLPPSRTSGDQLPATGPASFGAYKALYPGKPWTLFLDEWLRGSNTQTLLDQGEERFESYLVWDERAVAANANVDIWILEPDGKVYIPLLGSVTPNGRLTDESRATGTFYEGYLTNRHIRVGLYRIFASLYADPQGFQPEYNLAYRFGQSTEFRWLLRENGRLSKDRSWLDDPNATIEKVESGAYTDLRGVASWEAGGSGAWTGAVAGGVSAMTIGIDRGAGPRLTTEQLRTVRQRLLERRRDGTIGPMTPGLDQRRGGAIPQLPTRPDGAR